MSNYLLDFETPLKEIEARINTLKNTSVSTGVDVKGAIKKLLQLVTTKIRMISSWGFLLLVVLYWHFINN